MVVTAVAGLTGTGCYIESGLKVNSVYLFLLLLNADMSFHIKDSRLCVYINPVYIWVIEGEY